MPYIWDEIWRRDPYADPDDRRKRAALRTSAIDRLLEGRTQLGRVLELGCGDGSFAASVAVQPQWRLSNYLGIDRSSTAIDRAKKQPVPGETYSFQAGDIETLQFTGRDVDTFFALGVLEHIEDAGAVLRNIASAGNPGSRLIISTSNTLSLMFVDRLVREARRTWPYGYQRNYKPRELTCLLHPHFTIRAMTVVQEDWRYLGSAIVDRIGHVFNRSVGRYLLAVAELNQA